MATTISTFTTDLKLSLVSNISGPRIIIPNDINNGLRITKIDNSESQIDFLTIDSKLDNIFLQKLTNATGLNVSNNFNVQGAAKFNEGPVSVDGILNINNVTNSNEFGNGCLILSGGEYISKDLFVNGEGYKPNSQFWAQPSDKRIKKEIKSVNVQNCIDSIKNLKIKTFKYDDNYKSLYNLKDRIYVGVIADDVLETHPNCVQIMDKKDINLSDFKNVNLGEQYYEIIAVVQHLLSEVENLKNENTILKNLVNKK
jgi:hypothetical protein